MPARNPQKPAAGVGRFQSPANLQHDARRLLGRKFASFEQQGSEVLALDEIHGDELDSAGLAQIENTDDILVGYLPGENQFLLEAPQDLRISGELRANELQGDNAI